VRSGSDQNDIANDHIELRVASVELSSFLPFMVIQVMRSEDLCFQVVLFGINPKLPVLVVLLAADQCMPRLGQRRSDRDRSSCSNDATRCDSSGNEYPEDLQFVGGIDCVQEDQRDPGDRMWRVCVAIVERFSSEEQWCRNPGPVRWGSSAVRR
jgi:hypothetical protein